MDLVTPELSDDGTDFHGTVHKRLHLYDACDFDAFQPMQTAADGTTAL